MSANGSIWVVVPSKRFDQAKRRLDPLLDPSERVELAHRMFSDVLATVSTTSRVAGVLVVTSDPDATRIAQSYNAEVLEDPSTGGLNAAVDAGIAHLVSHHRDGILAIPADIPHVRAGDINEVIGILQQSPSVVLVAAARDGGTNLLAATPANAIRPSFGVGSYDRHIAAARASGSKLRYADAPSFALDLDRPEDLQVFLSLQSSTRSHAFLSKIGVPARLQLLVNRSHNGENSCR